MNHTLVTFLGRTRRDPNTGYRRARYRFPGKNAPSETPFFGIALAEHLQPDGTVILGTSGSQWSVLVEHLAQGDEAEPHGSNCSTRRRTPRSPNRCSTRSRRS